MELETANDVSIPTMWFRAGVDFIAVFLILHSDAFRCARAGVRSGALFSAEEHHTIALIGHFYCNS